MQHTIANPNPVASACCSASIHRGFAAWRQVTAEHTTFMPTTKRQRLREPSHS
jgi:hypothetical protein